jgi:hypothetical protein
MTLFLLFFVIDAFLKLLDLIILLVVSFVLFALFAYTLVKTDASSKGSYDSRDKSSNDEGFLVLVSCDKKGLKSVWPTLRFFSSIMLE